MVLRLRGPSASSGEGSILPDERLTDVWSVMRYFFLATVVWCESFFRWRRRTATSEVRSDDAAPDEDDEEQEEEDDGSFEFALDARDGDEVESVPEALEEPPPLVRLRTRRNWIGEPGSSGEPSTSSRLDEEPTMAALALAGLLDNDDDLDAADEAAMLMGSDTAFGLSFGGGAGGGEIARLALLCGRLAATWASGGVSASDSSDTADRGDLGCSGGRRVPAPPPAAAPPGAPITRGRRTLGIVGDAPPAVVVVVEEEEDIKGDDAATPGGGFGGAGSICESRFNDGIVVVVVLVPPPPPLLVLLLWELGSAIRDIDSVRSRRVEGDRRDYLLNKSNNNHKYLTRRASVVYRAITSKLTISKDISHSFARSRSPEVVREISQLYLSLVRSREASESNRRIIQTPSQTPTLYLTLYQSTRMRASSRE